MNDRLRLLRRAKRRIKTLLLINLQGYKGISRTAFFNGRSKIAKDVKIGEHSFVNYECYISSGTIIKDYVMLGPRVAIVGSDHSYDQPGNPIIFSGRPPLKMTLIDSDAWIGYGSIIMSGVTIGQGAIVAAGSIVTKDVEPLTIVGGIPAKKITDRFESADENIIHLRAINGPLIDGDPPRPHRR